VRIILLSCLAFILGAYQAGVAEPTEAETAYLDLIYGHCFENVAGKRLRDKPGDPEIWERSGAFDVSETSMQGAEDKLDLRFIGIGEAELMVDLKNKEICWTQISGVSSETMAARIRLSVLDEIGGSVLDEKVERSQSGQLSRVTTFGLLDWSETDLPVLIVREMLSPRQSVLTTQVLLGQKAPE